MSEKIQCIEVEYTEDGMFGPDPDTRENVDIPASFVEWNEQLTAALNRAYPDAEITVENTIHDRHSAQLADGFKDDAATEAVGEIIHQVWEDWNWVVATR